MKQARLIVLGVALAAGGAAAYLMMGTKPPPPAVVEAAPQIETEDVLVASKDLAMGTLMTEPDMSWQTWPRSSVTGAMIKRGETPKAIEDIKGSVTRAQFFEGEPMRREKLVKGPNSGFLSAILPSGKRAVAIAIEASGASSAGGFILPNDRVDVIRTFRDEAAARASGGDVFVSETVLTNVRVLAIGQNVQEKNGERVVVGSNATLELDPRQAETIILAQRVGQLSLTLRSMLDAAKADETPERPDDKALTVVRFGVATQGGR